MFVDALAQHSEDSAHESNNTMEFACDFVYVPPSLSQKNCQRFNVNVIKRSALLPPVKPLANCKPPPPCRPPINFAEIKSPKSSPSSPKIFDQLEKSKEVKKVVRPTPLCENVEFQNKIKAFSSIISNSQQTSPPRRTAVTPPHMRPATNTQWYGHKQPLDNSERFTFDLPINEPNLNGHHQDPNYSYCTLKGFVPADPGSVPAQTASQTPPPTVPPRPSFMKLVPEYVTLLPSPALCPSSSQKSDSNLSSSKSSAGSTDKGPLPGNPNVVLVSLGKLLSEKVVQPIKGKPTTCSQCGSVLDSCYDNVITVCCFCQSSELTSPPSTPKSPLRGYQDGLFLLNPDEKPVRAANALLILCIDISGSMSLTSQFSKGELVIRKSRLQFVQEAVLQCVQRLSEQQPEIRVGLITFNDQVTVYGSDNFKTRFLKGAQLANTDSLKEAAHSFPIPPPLSQTKHFLQKQVAGLSERGITALGPAALLAITMAARQPGSQVIICTDGKANTDLGNLEVEDNDAHTLLSSTIFYRELGEYAANQGVTVSVLSIEGTDCRLDELGRLADRTGGKVVIASPNRLHPEFEQIIENRTIATHCSVTLLLPRSLRVRGEREAGSKGTREVGNVGPSKEITFQFGANELDAGVPAPSSGSRVSIQLQIRYRQRNGQKMLRVITLFRDVTDDSLAVLSSLSLAIIQLNSSQAIATLAVRGRFLDARKEGEMQRKLIERAIEHSRSAEDKRTYQEWVKTMAPIYDNMHNYTRRKCVLSDKEPLTDAGAALLYTLKHINRKSNSWKKTHPPNQLPASTFYNV